MATEPIGWNRTLKKGVSIARIVGKSLIVALLAATLSLLSACGKKQAETTPEPDTGNTRSVLVTPENVEEVAQEFINEKYVEPGYFAASMSNVWHFATGDAISEDAYVANRTENTNDVYFDLFLADNQDAPIYESPVIPRGGALENFALDADLDAGTYDCLMIYHLVDENQETVSTLQVEVTVIVEG